MPAFPRVFAMSVANISISPPAARGCIPPTLAKTETSPGSADCPLEVIVIIRQFTARRKAAARTQIHHLMGEKWFWGSLIGPVGASADG